LTINDIVSTGISSGLSSRLLFNSDRGITQFGPTGVLITNDFRRRCRRA
jgi:hypothetical protein